MNTTKKANNSQYSDYAFITDLELIKGYQARETTEISKIKDTWDRLSKERRANFKYKLVIEALTTMHSDGFRPACCLYTIIQNFDSIFEGDI